MKKTVYLIGTSFRKAPLDRVARVQWPDETGVGLFSDRARAALRINELFFLQTCNRREFYIHSDAPPAEGFQHDFLNMLSEDLGCTLLADDFYILQNDDAVRHMFRVASSLDSMVLGETEIMKQIKDQAARALNHGGMDRHLKALTEVAIRVAKKVRHQTRITHNVVSMASLAYRSVMDHVGGKQRKRVVFVGAGHFIQSIMPSFTKSPELELLFVNRTLPVQLAETYDGTPITLDEFKANPPEFDAMVSATGAPEAMFNADFMADRGDLLLLDAGLPRNIDERCAQLPGVTYMDLGAMEDILSRNREARKAEIPKAEPIFAEGLEKLHGMFLEIDLSSYSRQIAGHYRETGEKMLAHLKKEDFPNLSEDDMARLESWTQSLVGKLTNIPILGLKGVARDHGAGAVQSFTRQVAEKAPLFRN